MVTVTEPSSVAVGAGAASQGWNRSGTWSSGAEGQNQQMNRAWLSSFHRQVGRGAARWRCFRQQASHEMVARRRRTASSPCG
jgi:hypothetical protein